MSFLLFMETSGNQAYLYATNRLKENIGASELTYRTGTRWLLEAVANAGGPSDIWQENDQNPASLRQRLRDGHTKNDIEIILATSGKGLLRVEKRECAEKIMREVSTRALQEAPGLDICGAIVELNGYGNAAFAAAYTEAHHRYNAARNLMPSPMQRHAMLPGLERCASSGLPAREKGKVGETSQPLADGTIKKRERASDWFQRIGALMAGKGGEILLGRSMDQLEKRFDSMDWMGLVFADGNGLGQLFMNFQDYLGGKHYAETLREFSLAIDECTEAAFHAACAELARHAGETKGSEGGSETDNAKSIIPVVPLVLGGDDLTLVMDGRHALDFARTFLCTFEQESGKKEIIQQIAKAGLGAPRLSACAGVAVVKPHFPFHTAHGLAEALLKSAKKVKTHVKNSNGEPFPCSALDFHILYDSTFTDLEILRDERRTVTEGNTAFRLYGGPYVVTPADPLKDATEGADWANQHRVEALTDRVRAMSEKDADGRHLLPNSQMHALREALTLGRGIADGRLADLRRHYGEKLDALCEDKDSLFRQEGKEQTTRFLDALSSCGFWNTPVKEESKV